MYLHTYVCKLKSLKNKQFFVNAYCKFIYFCNLLYLDGTECVEMLEIQSMRTSESRKATSCGRKTDAEVCKSSDFDSGQYFVHNIPLSILSDNGIV